MERMIEIYKVLEQKQNQFIEQIQLLAILPETMSNKDIIEKFGCSSIAVKTVRKLPLGTTPTHHQEFGTIIRNGISPTQTDHFSSWLLDTNMLTTVAWGVSKITYGSAISNTLLRYILDHISATEQEALSGIDDIVKNAPEGWIVLEELVSLLKISKDDCNTILTKVKSNKLYLKTLFMNHCSEQQTNTCTTLCTTYS